MQRLSEKTQFWVSFSPGSAEEQVRWDEKINYILIAYFVGNTCVKNYRNWAMYVKIIASQKVESFIDTMYIPV